MTQRLLTVSWLGATCYGKFAALYGVCVTASYLADAGASSSWACAYDFITCCRGHVIQIWRWYMFTHFLLAVVFAAGVAVGARFLWPQPLTTDLVLCVISLVLLQTILSACRQFLYVVGVGKRIALQETSLLITFFFVKMAGLQSGIISDFAGLVYFHTLYDFAVLLCLMLAAYIWWSAMQQTTLCTRSINWQAVAGARAAAYAIRLSRYFTSGRYLTPFFALVFGFQYAGVYALTTKTIKSAISVIKMFGYAGIHEFASAYKMSGARAYLVLRSLVHTAGLLGLVSLAVCGVVVWWVDMPASLSAISSLHLVWLYLCICLSEGVVALFESCMLTVGKARSLLIARGLEMLAIIMLLTGVQQGILSFFIALCAIAICRFIGAGVLYAMLVRACQPYNTRQMLAIPLSSKQIVPLLSKQEEA